MSIFNEPVVFVDIETTGISGLRSRILELAAIRVVDDQVAGEFSSLVDPGTAVPSHITRLTGITAADVAGQPYFADIAGELQRIMNGAVFIAHSARFDLSFIKRQMEGCGHRFNPKTLCTLRLSRALYPSAKGHSLAALIERHGLQVNARHRAYDDARVLWDFCQLAHREAGEMAFDEAVAKQFKSRTLPPHLQPEQVEGLTNQPGVYIFADEEGAPVYVGKSVSLRSRVLSHFAQSATVNKEIKLSQATHQLRVIPTGGELEALLLESRLVNELLPLYNRQLRRARGQAVLQKQVGADGYIRLRIETANLADVPDLETVYGVYPNRMKAKEALLRARRAFALCPRLLGLEAGKGHCFQYQLRRCRGACGSLEPAGAYNRRVELALVRSKIEQWPYGSPVLISEQAATGQLSGVVVDQWCVTARLKTERGGALALEHIKKCFDHDTYKILRGFLRTKKDKVRITPLDAPLETIDLRRLALG